MNLIKCFNMKYLIENIKKSKMAIALFTFAMPILTILVLINYSDDRTYYYDVYEIGGINIFFMYIIPVVFSICMFGYVYKKNSADFIGSMPLSRKTIFITNTIGGIVLIFITQLLALVGCFAVSAFFDSILFSGLVWDVFWYQTIGYIFVYTVTNLAMSLSGNARMQIVLTLLILFLVPFTSIYVKSNVGMPQTFQDNVEEVYFSYIDDTVYVDPFMNIIANGSYSYSAKAIVKMLVLSVIYCILGYFCFSKKKFENAGESFEKPIIHLIVKGLTLVPFVAIFMEMNSIEEALLILGITFIYWLIYDLVTNKRPKLWKNILAFIIAGALVIAGFIVEESIYSKYIDYKSDEMSRLYLSNARKVIVTDIRAQDCRISFKEGFEEDAAVLLDMIAESEDLNRGRIEGEIYTNNGQKYKYRMYVNYEKLEAYVKEKELTKADSLDDKRVAISKYIVNAEMEKQIKQLIANDEFVERNVLYANESYYISSYVNSMPMEIKDEYSVIPKYYINLIEYEDHSIVVYTYEINKNEALTKLILEMCNTSTAEIIKKNSYDVYLNKVKLFNINTSGKYGDSIYLYGPMNDGEIEKLVMESAEEEVDFTKPFAVLYFEYDRVDFCFVTNKVAKVLTDIEERGFVGYEEVNVDKQEMIADIEMQEVTSGETYSQ